MWNVTLNLHLKLSNYVSYLLKSSFLYSSSFQRVLMGRLRLGYMIMRVQELIMMRQVILAQQWLTVLTVQGMGCIVNSAMNQRLYS